ncbi:MAG: hypothetical protein QOE05_142 [Actinomycetota bacterium]|jgi:hypothetical protein|nr:hypothetical protein [Actinomycetota bacterium]
MTSATQQAKGRADASASGSRTLGEAAGNIAGTFESAAAEKAESAVSGRGFATLLGWVAENVIAVTRIGSDVADLAVRNLRLAGRKDLARLGVQQARTEDKLERLLAEVEQLEAELRRAREAERKPAR